MPKNRKIPFVKHCKAAHVAAAILIALLTAGPVAHAADPTPATNRWESVVAAGVTLTRGNSRNFLGTANVGTARKWKSDELLLRADGGYGETTATVSGT